MSEHLDADRLREMNSLADAFLTKLRAIEGYMCDLPSQEYVDTLAKQLGRIEGSLANIHTLLERLPLDAGLRQDASNLPNDPPKTVAEIVADLSDAGMNATNAMVFRGR